MTGFGYNVNGFGVGSAAAVFQRGVVGGGSGRINVIQYVDIATLGDAADFGDLSASKDELSSMSNLTRGIFAGGNTGTQINVMEYVTIATTGDATDFGDLLSAVRQASQGSVNNATRGIIGGGYTAAGTQNVIQYVTIGSTGNSTDFGDLTSGTYRGYLMAACSSSTRGIFGLGGDASEDNNKIDYITIASTGNASDFGDGTQGRDGASGSGNSVRGLFAQGYDGGEETFHNIIDYITIASTGNATDFGDASTTSRLSSAMSGPTRSIINVGASSYPYASNIMEYVTIASTGNSVDFGDLTESAGMRTAFSSANGGSV